jgi:hypothetical protein
MRSLPPSLLCLSSFSNTTQQIPSVASTIGVDFSGMNLGKGEINMWDFSGQPEYTVHHQHFLSKEVNHEILFEI